MTVLDYYSMFGRVEVLDLCTSGCAVLYLLLVVDLRLQGCAVRSAVQVRSTPTALTSCWTVQGMDR